MFASTFQHCCSLNLHTDSWIECVLIWLHFTTVKYYTCIKAELSSVHYSPWVLKGKLKQHTVPCVIIYSCGHQRPVVIWVFPVRNVCEIDTDKEHWANSLIGLSEVCGSIIVQWCKDEQWPLWPHVSFVQLAASAASSYHIFIVETKRGKVS